MPCQRFFGQILRVLFSGLAGIPRDQRLFHRLLASVQFAICQVQIPICVFDVADIVPQRDREVGGIDIVVDLCDQDAVVNPGSATGTGDAVKFQAGSLQQRLADFAFQPRLPGRRKRVGRSIVGVVVGHAAQRQQ